MPFKIIISGKVQGVFYRQSTKEKAVDLNITGYVKNLSDGRVEIIAEGERVKELIEWCWQGPEKALVSNVEVSEVQVNPYPDFKVLR